ncbi:thermonuclease family protein [Phaeobacter sp. NW0010-22]|uniref:thermonuclease family protein n=1 Tax=Phaeobacter sp. NW0010-22 TaxID=3135907 RepID=UPI00310322BC
MRQFSLTVLTCLIGAGCQPNAPTPTITDSQVIGPVTHVRDGDTIEVADVPIRLNGVTCDELGTPMGKQATATMRTLVAGQRVSCSLSGQKSYDRKIGRCQLATGQDLGEELISQGVCGRCERYDKQGTYVRAQTNAGPFRGKIPKYCN